VRADGTIILEQLSPQVFQEFLLSRRNTKKKSPNFKKRVGLASLRDHRSGLRHLFKEAGVAMPQEFQDSLTLFFAGIKRIHAREKQSGQRKTKEVTLCHVLSVFNICSRVKALSRLAYIDGY